MNETTAVEREPVETTLRGSALPAGPCRTPCSRWHDAIAFLTVINCQQAGLLADHRETAVHRRLFFVQRVGEAEAP